MTDEEVDALSDAHLYLYLLNQDALEWAKVINRKSHFGLSASNEECLSSWIASAMMSVVDHPNQDYIRARIDAEK